MCTIVLESGNVIATHLMPQFIRTPYDEALRDVVHEFVHLGFPQADGAIHGTHIPVICPEENSADSMMWKDFTPLSCGLWFITEAVLLTCMLDGQAGYVMLVFFSSSNLFLGGCSAKFVSG